MSAKMTTLIVPFPMEAHPHYVVMHNGAFLCRGNPNSYMYFHESWIDIMEDNPVLCDTRQDAVVIKNEWLQQLRRTGTKVRSNAYKVVKVQFYWAECKRGVK